MSSASNYENTNDKQKLQNFMGEIKFPRNFKKKLYEIYLNEYDEKLDQILVKKDSEFMNMLLKRVRTILQDMYSNDCFDNEELGILMKTYEIEIYEKHYKPQFNLLSKALSSYESDRYSDPEISENNEMNNKADFFYDEDSMTIVEINLKEEKDSYKILKEKMSEELSFRKHCIFIDDVPRHFCKNGNFTNFIKLRSLKNSGNITHLICADCKLSYKSACVLLFCNFCSLSFYSSLSNYPIETSYLQPATWEKYHCSMIVNDQMRCIKCKEVLFLDLKENLLKCFNEKCMFESDPYSIYWTCVTCKQEFQTNSKIYNPLEYKLVRSSIKEALILKKEAKPDFLPCCQDHSVNDDMVFLHKKECSGRIFLGTMHNRSIIVCEKCRSLSNYDKFIWTCPICSKRFKNKNIEKSSEGGSSVTNNDSSFKYDKKMASTSSTINIMESDQNMTPLSGNTKERGIDSRSISHKGSLNTNSYKINENSSNVVGSNSIASQNSSDKDKMYAKSNTNSSNNKEKLESDLKILNYTNNKSVSADNSLKATRSNSIKTRENFEVPDQSENEKNDYFYISEKKLTRHKTITQSFSSVKSIEEEKPRSIAFRNIQVFKHNKNIKNYDAEIESNPVKRFIGKNRPDQGRKVTFLEKEQSKKVFKLLGTNDEINEKSKSPRIFVPILDKIDTSTKNLSSKNLLKNSHILNEYSNEEKESNPNNSNKLISSINNIGFDYFNMDEYVVDSLIGEGAYAQIYKIHDDKDNYYALKKNILHDNSEIECLMKQYIIIKKLRHPFILDIKGISIQKLDLTTTSIYVLMDLASNDWGKEIKARSIESPKKFYSEEELLQILKQLTKALAYMQRMNVAHRDLKPHNILIFENFMYKIADFGETQFLKENPFGETDKQSNEKKDIRGTELFMSPILYQALKNFKNENEISHNPFKSDCFSFGLCILYAASLSLDVLYYVRKIGFDREYQNEFDIYEKSNDKLEKILSNEIPMYSAPFKNLLNAILNINEKERPDFIELEKILRNF
jgi:hypothetical protein